MSLGAADLQLIGIVLNGLAVPGIYLLARILWRLDRRVLQLELALRIPEKDREP